MADSKTSSAAVGYCRPPEGARFRKGQSGNPAGRPKGSRNRHRRPPPARTDDPLGALIREEAYRLIKVNENGEEIHMPIARAVIRSLIVTAVRGDLRAQAAFLKMVSGSEAGALTQDDALDQAAQSSHEIDEIVIRIIDPALPK